MGDLQKIGMFRSMLKKSSIGILSLNIQIPAEVWCFRYVFGVQVPSQEVFGCLGCTTINYTGSFLKKKVERFENVT